MIRKPIRYRCFHCDKIVRVGEIHTLNDCLENQRDKEMRRRKTKVVHIFIATGILWSVAVIIFILWLREIS